jgi:hypothetical protein
MKLLVTLFLLCGPVLGQSRDSLKATYGNPVAETFVVRPGVIVTASYSQAGRITELVLAPQNTDLIKSRGKALTRDLVKTLLAELVPPSERGKLTGTAFLNLTCLPENDCGGTAEDYERVNIYFNAANNGDIHYAVVKWRLN